jgi:hypothetical protein
MYPSMISRFSPTGGVHGGATGNYVCELGISKRENICPIAFFFPLKVRAILQF